MRQQGSDTPQITPVPTEAEFKKLVDRVITPEYADVEAKALVELILTVANPEDDSSWGLANAAARYAFSKTDAFEDAFRRFAGYPDNRAYSSNRHIVHAEQEM